MYNKEIEQIFNLNNIDISLKETKAYIHGIFVEFIKSGKKDLSNKSITLEYFKAKETYNFIRFQTLADWIFFVQSLYPEYATSSEYYNAIAKCSYYKCYVILDRKWACFEELADRFDYFVENITPLSRPDLF